MSSATPAPEQALAPRKVHVPEVITSPDDYRSVLSEWQRDGYNVLTPFSTMTGIMPGYGLIAAAVKLNPNKEGGEVYYGVPWVKPDEVALAKIGLRKLAELAGIEWTSERTDDRRTPNFWEFRITARYRGLDGMKLQRQATMEWDLRDGSQRLKGFEPRQIEEARKHGLRNCEARAINAAIRECGCGIKQTYKKAALDKPFIVVRVGFQPDMSIPEVRAAVIAAQLGGSDALYAHVAAQGVLDDEGADEAGHPVQAGSGQTDQAAADRPPTADAVRIVKVTEATVKVGRQDRLQYQIVDSMGEQHATFDAEIASAARALATSQAWVELASHEGALLELTKVGDTAAGLKL